MIRDVSLPSVTMALLTYNHARVVRPSIESLLQQNYQNFEVVVQDDHSSDETIQIAAQFAARDPRVRLSKTPKNMGGWGNLAVAAEESKSDFICWACPGDNWDSNFISTLVEKLRLNSDAVAAMCGTIDVDEETRLECGRRPMSGEGSPANMGWLQLACAVLMKTRPAQVHRPHYSLMLHGLIHRRVLRDVLRSYQGLGPILNERAIVAHLALVGPFVVSDRWLFEKERHVLPALARGPHVVNRVARANARLLYSRITYQAARAMFRSAAIPSERKLSIPLVVGQYFARSLADAAFIRMVSWMNRWLPSDFYHSVRRFYRRLSLRHGGSNRL